MQESPQALAVHAQAARRRAVKFRVDAELAAARFDKEATAHHWKQVDAALAEAERYEEAAKAALAAEGGN